MVMNPTPRDAEYVEAYKKYGTQTKAAAACGVSRETVARAVRRAGIPLTGRSQNGKNGQNHPGRKITDDELIECVKTMTRQEIADKYGMHIDSIDKRMSKLGIHAVHAMPQSRKGIYRITDAEMHQRVNTWSDGQWKYIARAGGKLITMQCNTCGEEITRDYKEVKKYHTVCPECKRREKNGKIKQIEFMLKKCKYCGKEFLTTQKDRVYCDSRCKEKNKRHKANCRIRARYYGVYYDPSISLKKVIERDHGVCQICGKACDFDDKSWGAHGPMYPSIDHIQPFAKGGNHTWDNVQLAHCICNSYKRDLI